MELHELISLNQTNCLEDWNESAVDVPDSLINMNKKAKYKFDNDINLIGYINNGFMSECLDNQLNMSKETGFNDFTIEESIDGPTKYRTISFEKKENEPLGLTIKNDKNDSVIIGRVIKGGLASEFGLTEGDEIIKINQINIKGRNINEISDALCKTSGKLVFVIIKNKESFQLRPNDTELNLRALFDYNPEDDAYIPCRELGIHFKKGQILHVVDQSDPLYWQANIDINSNNNNCLAGLIPSNNFQVQRNLIDMANVNNKKGKLSMFCRKKKKSKERLKNSLVYEKVSLLYPNKIQKRPIILVGPQNMGIFELRKLLIQNDDRLATAVPHTSRRKILEEINGFDYHFCSQSEFEKMIKENRFIEYGKYANDYYGLSIASILAVIHSSKICLMNLNPSTIEKIRNNPISSTLKPYFIFISAQLDDLQRTDDLQELRIIEESRQIDAMFGQYFDCTIIRTSLEETYAKLVEEINSLEFKPKWVPTSWTMKNYGLNHFS